MAMSARPAPAAALPPVVAADAPLQPGAFPACASCAVRPEALFASLSHEQLAAAHGLVRPLTFDAERPVFGRGHLGTGAFTIRSGLVRFERITERGDRRIVRLAGRGDLIGQEALLAQPFADDAIACTPVAVCAIPAPVIDELSTLHPPLRRDVMLRWQQALDIASAWTADICTGPARRRMLKLLETLHAHADDGRRIWLPRREILGAMLDVALETASRLVSQLRAEGVLTLLPDREADLDAAALARALAAAND